MVRDTDIANDIMQDTLIKVMCSLQEGRYEDKGKFAMWAMRIAHNHAMNYFRGKRLTMEANIDDSEALLPLGEDFSDLNVEEQAIIIEQRKDVHKMLNFLPSNQRQIVLMRYYSNMSFKEIADLLKININTALGRMHYAIINLRKMMEKHRNSLQTLVV
jgi:RNA polymerase sigma-70 factor (ECF subfamily)